MRPLKCLTCAASIPPPRYDRGVWQTFPTESPEPHQPVLCEGCYHDAFTVHRLHRGLRNRVTFTVLDELTQFYRGTRQIPRQRLRALIALLIDLHTILERRLLEAERQPRKPSVPRPLPRPRPTSWPRR